MPPTEGTEPLVRLFKALGDASRIKLLGLLADKPHSVEELAASLGISSATVSHHLGKLVKAELVEARALQYYNVYALRPDTLRRAAEQLQSLDSLKATAEKLDKSSYTKQVLEGCFSRGRLKKLPTQVRKRLIVLDRLAREFQAGKRYPERRVNKILRAFYSDPDELRDSLVSARLLSFEEGSYRRT